MRANPDLLLFKKIDSTLRGNVGAELAAALHASRDVRPGAPRRIAIMAPAFPAFGRTTKDGTQLVHGQPLHDLDIWRVQGMNGHAHIPDMLRHAGLQCEVLGLDVIRSARGTLSHAMNAAAQVADVLVCDAETDDDLLAIATASMQLAASQSGWVPLDSPTNCRTRLVSPRPLRPLQYPCLHQRTVVVCHRQPFS